MDSMPAGDSTRGAKLYSIAKSSRSSTNDENLVSFHTFKMDAARRVLHGRSKRLISEISLEVATDSKDSLTDGKEMIGWL